MSTERSELLQQAWHPHRFSRSAVSYKPQQARLLAGHRLRRKHHGWVLWVSEDSRVSGGCCEGSNRTPRSGGWQSVGSGCIGLYLSKQGASQQEGQLGATQAGWQAWRGSCLRTRGLEAGRSGRARTGVHMRGKAAGRGLPELSGQGSLAG